MSFKPPAVPVLRGIRNYHEWAVYAKAILMENDYYHVIKEPVLQSEASEDAITAQDPHDVRAWDSEKATAVALLKHICSSQIASQIPEHSTALEAWNHLKDTYDKIMFNHVYSTWRAFAEFRIRNRDNLPGACRAFRVVLFTAKHAGHKITYLTAICRLLFVAGNAGFHRFVDHQTSLLRDKEVENLLSLETTMSRLCAEQSKWPFLQDQTGVGAIDCPDWNQICRKLSGCF